MIRYEIFHGFERLIFILFICMNPMIYVTVWFIVFLVIQVVVVFTISNHYDLTQVST